MRHLFKWKRCALSAILFTFICIVTNWVMVKGGMIVDTPDFVVIFIGAMGGALMHDKEPL